MSKQVLDIEQMQHLQELGMELKETLLYWCRIHDSRPRAATNNGKWTLCKGKNNPCVAIQHREYIPAYTLQDVLDKLPKQIGFEYIYDLCILPESISYIQFIGGEINDTMYEIPINGKLLDAAYEMLCWCIKEGYVQTN